MEDCTDLRLTAEQRALALIFGGTHYTPTHNWKKGNWSVFGDQLVEALEAAERRGRVREWERVVANYHQTRRPEKSPDQTWEDKWVLGVDTSNG